MPKQIQPNKTRPKCGKCLGKGWYRILDIFGRRKKKTCTACKGAG